MLRLRLDYIERRAANDEAAWQRQQRTRASAFGVELDLAAGCQCGHKPHEHAPTPGTPLYHCTACPCRLFMWKQKC